MENISYDKNGIIVGKVLTVQNKRNNTIYSTIEEYYQGYKTVHTHSQDKLNSKCMDSKGNILSKDKPCLEIISMEVNADKLIEKAGYIVEKYKDEFDHSVSAKITVTITPERSLKLSSINYKEIMSDHDKKIIEKIAKELQGISKDLLPTALNKLAGKEIDSSVTIPIVFITE